MRHEQRELEIKVQLSKTEIERLNRKLSDPEIASGPPSREKLRSIYFDTPSCSLRAMGVSLRLRQQGRSWIQTIKADKGINGGVSNPIELELPVGSGKPDLGAVADTQLGRTLQKAVGRAALHPLFETAVQRTKRRVNANGSEMELAIDEGEVRAKSARRKLCEAELELKSGNVSGLLDAAERIFAGSAVELSTQSKSDLGYELAVGKKIGKPQPKLRDRVEIRPQQSCLQAFRIILAAATQQVLANRQAVLDSSDPKGPHQIRIGLRKLRSALRALRPLLDSPSLRKFDGLAADLTRCVGTLRDADALVSSIYKPMELVAPDKKGLTEVYRALLQHREAKSKEVRSSLVGPQWSHLQLYLALWPRTLDEAENLHRPILAYARKILQTRWRKVRKFGRRLDQLTPEARHDMRKSLKQLRYLSEFFAPVFSKRDTRRYIECLKQLQDIFGYLNDVQMAKKLQSIDLNSSAAAATVNFMLGWHEAEAKHVWNEMDKAWRQLEKARQFWK